MQLMWHLQHDRAWRQASWLQRALGNPYILAAYMPADVALLLGDCEVRTVWSLCMMWHRKRHTNTVYLVLQECAGGIPRGAGVCPQQQHRHAADGLLQDASGAVGLVSC
jgi:hypothetical protein